MDALQIIDEWIKASNNETTQLRAGLWDIDVWFATIAIDGKVVKGGKHTQAPRLLESLQLLAKELR